MSFVSANSSWVKSPIAASKGLGLESMGKDVLIRITNSISGLIHNCEIAINTCYVYKVKD